MAKYKEPQSREMLKYLPAIYRETDGRDVEFLPGFLVAGRRLRIIRLRGGGLARWLVCGRALRKGWQ